MALIEGAGFRNATFIGCKLLGVDFTRCNRFLFSFSFQESCLDYCTFFGTKLRKTRFTGCSLKETDFTETDLTEAIFDVCDLSGTKFSSTILEKADFHTANNFDIDPDRNKMKKAKFSSMNLGGLLFKHQLVISHDG